MNIVLRSCSILKWPYFSILNRFLQTTFRCYTSFLFLYILMILKQKIYNHYLQVVNDKIKLLQKILADLKESSTNETKSTAGDKHETELTMLQIEQENTRMQLKDVLDKKAALEKINPSLSATKIVKGSLVKTNKGYLFVSIALGKATIEDMAVTALSPQSPLGTKLMGLTVADVTEVDKNLYIIESIE